jgi:hypothetical protein
MALPTKRTVLTSGVSLVVGTLPAARALAVMVDAGFSPYSVAVLTYGAWVIAALAFAAIMTFVWRRRDRRLWHRAAAAQPVGPLTTADGEHSAGSPSI